MTPDEITQLVRERTNQTGSYVFDRMFSAMEKVRERLDRACSALAAAGISYAVIGGNAVAAWVATIDDGAVRSTRDVDLLLRESDLDRATEALESVGFFRDQVMDVTVFLDGKEGKPSQGLHILLAGEKVKKDYATPTPDTEDSTEIEGKRIVNLVDLVGMKLNSYRRKDQTHLLDMIGVGLIDETWPALFPQSLGERLQVLIDDPDG